MNTYVSRRALVQRVQAALAGKPRLSERGRRTQPAHPLVERPPGVLDQVAAILQSGRGYFHVSIYLDGGTLLVLRGSAGAPTRCLTMKFGEGVVGAVARSGRLRVVADVNADADYQEVLRQTRTELAAPIRIAGRVFGVVNLESDRTGAFSYGHRVLVAEVAQELAVFLGTRGKFLLLEAREAVANGLVG